MKHTSLILVTLLLSSCASYSPLNEREWVKDHIDTGALDEISISSGKAIFSGSVSKKYSNISENEVQDISLDFLHMLETKYGKENVMYVERNVPALYEISYEILNNEIAHKTNKSGRTECFVSTRNMSVNLSVKNIETKVLVWGGTIDKSMESSNCKERSEIKSESLAGVFVEAFINSAVESTFDSIRGTYKEPPSPQKVAGRAILGFYKAMP